MKNAPFSVSSSNTDQARDEVTGKSDEEGVGIDSDDSDGVKDVGPPPDIPHVSGHWPSVMNQQLLCIRSREEDTFDFNDVKLV